MVLCTTDKVRMTITGEEANAALASITKGDRFIILRGAYIMCNCITGVYPDAVMDDKNVGYLHDGTRVIKHFGAWKDATDPSLVLNPRYYPEIATDTVMTESEYLKKKGGLLLPPNGELPALPPV